MSECKLCEREVPENIFDEHYEICHICLSKLNAKLEMLKKVISEEQNSANSATTPAERILHLKIMLDYLYEYKVLYYDNGVDILTTNVEDMIDEVIDCISEAKL